MSEQQTTTEAPAEAGAANTTEAPSRPEWLGENDAHFFDAEAGQVRADQLYKSYSELRSAFGKRVHDLSPEARKALISAVPDDMRSAWEQEARQKFAEDEEFINPLLESRLPKPPEAYEIAPETLPEGLELDKDSEIYAAVEDLARKHALPNEAFNELVKIGAQIMAPPRPLEERIAELSEAFPKETAVQVVTAARNAVPEAERAGLDALLARIHEPAEFKALAALVNGRREKAAPDPVAGPAMPALDQNKLESMMQDERYWHPQKRDPSFIEEVTAGFRKLYGDTI